MSNKMRSAARGAAARLLAALREFSPQTAEELAAATGLVLKTVCNTLSGLKQQALVIQPRYRLWALPPDNTMPDASLSRLSQARESRETRETRESWENREGRESVSESGEPNTFPVSQLSQARESREPRENAGEAATRDAAPWAALQERFRLVWWEWGYLYDSHDPFARRQLHAALALGDAFQRAWQQRDWRRAEAAVAELETLADEGEALEAEQVQIDCYIEGMRELAEQGATA